MLIRIRSARKRTHTHTHIRTAAAARLRIPPLRLSTFVGKYLCCPFSARNVSFVDIFLTAPAPAPAPQKACSFISARLFVLARWVHVYFSRCTRIHFTYLHMFVCVRVCVCALTMSLGLFFGLRCHFGSWSITKAPRCESAWQLEMKEFIM